jgi:hypothetical protein
MNHNSTAGLLVNPRLSRTSGIADRRQAGLARQMAALPANGYACQHDRA